MKSKLRNLIVAVAVLSGGITLFYWLSQEETEAQESSRISPKTGSPAQHEIDAAAEKLTHIPWSAVVRLKGNFSGETVESVGNYQQFGGASQAIKLNLKFQLDGSIENLFSQTSDGRYIYTQRNYQDHVSLEHVDLGQVRRVLALHKRELPVAFAGVPKLLESLGEYYEWNAAPEIAAGDNQDMRRFIGSRIKAPGNVKTDALISALPESVDLVLSANPELPFPLRLEFYSLNKDGEKHSMFVAEFREIRVRQDLKLANFEFDPGENALIDATEAYLDQFDLPEPVVAGKTETELW